MTRSFERIKPHGGKLLNRVQADKVRCDHKFSGKSILF
jgi:hypothetical protein